MAFNYLGSRATADQLLTTFGQAASLVFSGSPTYDAATGKAVVVETVRPCIAAVFNYSDAERANSTIQTGDRKVIVSVTSVNVNAPKVGDRLEIGTETYKIVNVNVLAPGGVAVIYTCQVRK